MRVSLIQAKKMMLKFGVNPFPELGGVSPEFFQKGLQIEMEHGKRRSATNVTNDNLEKTAKIVIAHLLESPIYYQELIKMEARLARKK